MFVIRETIRKRVLLVSFYFDIFNCQQTNGKNLVKLVASGDIVFRHSIVFRPPS